MAATYSSWTLPGELAGITVLYEFVTEAEERYLLEKVDAIGGDGNKAGGWTSLNGRRSMYWGGTVTNSGALIKAPLPDFLTTAWPNLHQRITRTGAFAAFSEQPGLPPGPNHVLVNEYLPSQFIAPHTDGPAYSPLVATLSLNSHTIITLTPSRAYAEAYTDAPARLSVLLPPRSLFLLSGTLYSDFLHGIDGVAVDGPEALRGCANWEDWAGRAGTEERRRAEEEGMERGRRVSLTCRRVGKVRKGLRIG